MKQIYVPTVDHRQILFELAKDVRESFIIKKGTFILFRGLVLINLRVIIVEV